MTQGLHASLTDGVVHNGDCLVIGHGIPKIHHSDGLPVYLVTENAAGLPIELRDGTRVHLLAYPSNWPAPGDHNPDHWLELNHERLPWDGRRARVPCFDVALVIDAMPSNRPANLSEHLEQLRLPLPPWA